MQVNGSIIQSSFNHRASHFTTMTEKLIISCRCHQTLWPYYKHDVITLERFSVVIISIQYDYIDSSLLQWVIKTVIIFFSAFSLCLRTHQ